MNLLSKIRLNEISHISFDEKIICVFTNGKVLELDKIPNASLLSLENFGFLYFKNQVIINRNQIHSIKNNGYNCVVITKQNRVIELSISFRQMGNRLMVS